MRYFSWEELFKLLDKDTLEIRLDGYFFQLTTGWRLMKWPDKATDTVKNYMFSLQIYGIV